MRPNSPWDRHDRQHPAVTACELEVGGRATAAVYPASARYGDRRPHDRHGAARRDRLEECRSGMRVEHLDLSALRVDRGDPQLPLGPVGYVAQERGDRVEDVRLRTGPSVQRRSGEAFDGPLRVAGAERRPKEPRRWRAVTGRRTESAPESWRSYNSAAGTPAKSRDPKTAPAEVPITTSALRRSIPASVSPASTPVNQAPPTGPPPPSTSAVLDTLPLPVNDLRTSRPQATKRGIVPSCSPDDSIRTGECSRY